ncbi:acyl-CoA reductase-like NAD-dependent aldehyde dehydrogenase [Kitasatospora sp. GAS204A]|uniref:aldehyde dehydrogenase family protein n=1 Tax=unclassified Kitasatospora TaxID=2633591 RepID=UPI00247334F1|nr:aldehyde dehydrogenase family protein [Kitasatospora sp. GAS204B]MDH6117720.1 acyl-CoA reductase-like NAD-dependent aldehyde dehydrogenase [Kitasatospora sp. GAS204B]
MTSVLFVVTGATHWTLADGTAHPTGFWAEELAEPHRIFSEAGYRITVATPDGVAAPVDQGSLSAAANGGQSQADRVAAYLEGIGEVLAHPAKLTEIDPDDYDLVFYPGGHGPMEDLAVDEASGRILTRTLESGRPLGVVCHAPAALLAARRQDGGWPFAGYRMTAFSNAEEAAAGLAEKARWLLEDRLVELGADFVAAAPFAPHTVVDRNLYTGQNPGSSAELARMLVRAAATDPADVVARLRGTFETGRTRPLAWRLAQLAALRALLTERSAEFLAALHADLGKNEAEAYRSEIGFTLNELDHTVAHLEKWLAPRPAAVPAAFQPAEAQVVRDPLGVVLVIAPWNYPLQLALAPVVGALAAGNTVLVKPSELAPATSAALARLLPRYLAREAVAVVEGAVPETTALLEQRFDHIFYTGNGMVGRIVMTAAAKHLTPVTLELGGKSPAVVEPGADLAATAQRIARGKFQNAGQTCVAPDYVLAIGDTAAALEAELATAVEALYGPDPAASPAYGRVVNERHHDRLTALLGDGRLVTGGGHDRAARYLAPTVLADVSPEAPVMRAEIFGPVLPIVAVPDLDAAIAFINERDKPLALYAFTASERTKQRLTQETSSGGLVFGLTVSHLAVPELPFGGVGESGLGRYHGEYSIDTFSHLKAVLDKPLG